MVSLPIVALWVGFFVREKGGGREELILQYLR